MVIRLEINIGTDKSSRWRDVALAAGQTLSIERNSPLWNKASTFSEELELNIAANRDIFGNADHPHGRSIFAALYKREYRLWAEGLLIMQGTVDIDKEMELDADGNVSVTLTSGRKTLEDKLEGVKCRDVRLEDEHIVIGYANNVANGAVNDPDDPASQAYVTATIRYREAYGRLYTTKGVEKKPIFYDDFGFLTTAYEPDWSEMTVKLPVFNALQQLIVKPQKSVFQSYDPSLTDELIDKYMPPTVNTSEAYTGMHGARFCNVPICWQYYEQEGEEWKKRRGYQNKYKDGDAGTADRADSAPCFFVLYFIDLLFHRLNIPITANALMGFRDIRALTFVHVNCFYKLEKDPLVWKDSHGISNHFKAYFTRTDGLLKGNQYCFHHMDGSNQYLNNGEVGVVKVTSVKDLVALTKIYKDLGTGDYDADIFQATLKSVDGSLTNGMELNDEAFHRAYATSENLPDTDASSVIELLENMFCCRFIYNDIDGTMRVALVKDVLAQNAAEDLGIVDYTVTKKENHVDGFRLKYSGTSKKETNELKKEDEVVTGSDDTTFSYNDYDKTIVFNHQDTRTDTGKAIASNYWTYGTLINNVTCFDETCYIDSLTGNAYRIKVNADADLAVAETTDADRQALNPSLFEVGTFAPAEYGDCSDDDYVEEVSIDCSPVVPNDINYETEREYFAQQNDASGMERPNVDYRIFVDAELHDGQNGRCKYDLPVFSHRDVRDGKERNLMVTVEHNYPQMTQGWDVSQGFDNPLKTVDMGVTIGILRTPPKGGDGYGYVDTRADYDGEGNYSWMQVYAGPSCVTSDCLDSYGNILDNDASDAEQPISLKLRAEKTNPYHTATPDHKVYGYTFNPYDPDNEDNMNRTDERGRWPSQTMPQRGLFDRFYTEYAYWVVNRKVAVISVPPGQISTAHLMNLDFTKKYRIGRYVGFINKIRFSIDDTGADSITIELYYI